MLSEKQFENILELQAQMNSKVNPHWLNANYPFLRAAMMEVAEAIEHTGRWKWWKAPREMNLAQLQMEIVDIFHFMISAILVWNEGNITLAGKALKRLSESQALSVDFDNRTYFFDKMDLVDRLELMIGLSVSRRLDIPLFSAILKDCQMTWEDLYRQYMGKNVLNIFRQDKGYKEGTYRKTWLSLEDNIHLSEIILKLDANACDFRDQIYSELNARYVFIDDQQSIKGYYHDRIND